MISKNQKKASNVPSNSYNCLTEFIQKKGYFMFCWPIYYGQSAVEFPLTKAVDDLIQVIADSILPDKFLLVKDYTLLFAQYTASEPAFKMASFKMLKFRNSYKMSKHFVNAEAANGKYVYSEFYEAPYIVTDCVWFARMVDMIGMSKSKSNDFKKLCSILGRFYLKLIINLIAS